MDTARNADNFLKMIRNARRGKLKIYLGYCAGVGKTTQMLKEAIRLKHTEHVDVVVGLLETHGRAETAACLEDLEVIPRRMTMHRNIAVTEMDVPPAAPRWFWLMNLHIPMCPAPRTGNAGRMWRKFLMPEFM